ncbi:nutritionally-regulated adipose and cardiac enriched protein homolog isoform X1 [Trichosurus vulpecula]|uniref:nutritionally-regulated adipose and cardiac enriched protein homolog isoform X1 n=1 Tax=Trichosurus vulpecula TaxID=9337 RepID=UPI00186AC8AE|nr:nutritionally-regulated adipose and cardiac enriched protein homolog isoform X1 [Trichosurus vulpecula]
MHENNQTGRCKCPPSILRRKPPECPITGDRRRAERRVRFQEPAETAVHGKTQCLPSERQLGGPVRRALPIHHHHRFRPGSNLRGFLIQPPHFTDISCVDTIIEADIDQGLPFSFELGPGTPTTWPCSFPLRAPDRWSSGCPLFLCLCLFILLGLALSLYCGQARLGSKALEEFRAWLLLFLLRVRHVAMTFWKWFGRQ